MLAYFDTHHCQKMQLCLKKKRKSSEKPWFWRFLTWRHLWRHCGVIQGMFVLFWYQWTREGHSYPLVPHTGYFVNRFPRSGGGGWKGVGVLISVVGAVLWRQSHRYLMRHKALDGKLGAYLDACLKANVFCLQLRPSPVLDLANTHERNLHATAWKGCKFQQNDLASNVLPVIFIGPIPKDCAFVPEYLTIIT